MRKNGYLRIGLFGLAAAILAVVALTFPPAVVSQPDTLYLELEATPPGPGIMDLGQGGPGIPGNCATWHELFPNFCAPHHQDDYGDNGDGVISPCDVIKLNGVCWHIDWVGPTYHLEEVQTGGESWWEPSVEPGHNPGNPVCETWHQVHPVFCGQGHVDEWLDENGSGAVDGCDLLYIGGIMYHVIDVSVNIIVTPSATPTEPSTWGQIKTWIMNLF